MRKPIQKIQPLKSSKNLATYAKQLEQSSQTTRASDLRTRKHEINTLTTYQMKHHKVPQWNKSARDRKFAFWKIIKTTTLKKDGIYTKGDLIGHR